MLNQIWQKLRISKYLLLIIILLIGVFTGGANARSLDAGFVLKKMEVEQRYSYVAGVIEGLAFSRWLQDKPDDTGLKCIYDWYYKDGDNTNWKNVATVFEKYPNQKVGTILHALIKRDCGT